MTDSDSPELRHPRSHNPFWQQCYIAALTGLTMAGAVQIAPPQASAPAPLDEGDPGDALAVRSAAGPLAAPIDPLPEPTTDDDARSVFYSAIVQEAIAIADASCEAILGPLKTKTSHPMSADRPAPHAIGNVAAHKTR